MKLPWDIVEAKSSHGDSGDWTYPLKKTLWGLLYAKMQFWFRESPCQRFLGAEEAQRLGGWAGVGSAAVCTCPRRKKCKL